MKRLLFLCGWLLAFYLSCDIAAAILKKPAVEMVAAGLSGMLIGHLMDHYRESK